MRKSNKGKGERMRGPIVSTHTTQGDEGEDEEVI